jgi:hypothetical protein
MAGCQPSTPPPMPTDQIWNIQISHSVNWIANDLHMCANQFGDSAIFLEVKPDDTILSGEADFGLRWGQDGTINTPAFILGWDEIIPIVHPQNQITHISREEVEALYLGNMKTRKTQADGTTLNPELHPWGYSPTNEIQKIFVSSVLSVPNPNIRLSGIAPDPAAMLQVVSSDQNAIGFIPRRWLNGTVKTIPIENVDINRIRQPIIAITNHPPEGKLREWLLCLQSQLAQSTSE